MDPQSLRKTEQLNQIANELGITLSQLALAWNLRLPNISSCIIGVSSRQQFDENIQAVSVELDPEVLNKIEEVLNDTK